jgi:hypothetical protein
MECMLKLVLASKLYKTATSAQRSTLRQWHSLFRTMEDIQLPLPLLEVVDVVGNFRTDTELLMDYH